MPPDAAIRRGVSAPADNDRMTMTYDQSGVEMEQPEANPWQRAQKRLKESLDEHSYRNWFSQTRFERLDDDCLVVAVPSEFFANWLREHYQEAAERCVRETHPNLKRVRFVPTTDGQRAPGVDDALTQQVERPTGQTDRTAAPTPKRRSDLPGFNPRYVFDRFVVGSGNRFAHAAARAVAENPSRAYNPLFLYSVSGLGKTHLMQAIGQEVAARRPGSRVLFISSEQFTNQLIDCIARKAMAQFRDKYRKVDVLLIDDIQFIAGKEGTQEEIFHTFNTLFDNHKQIVLSSDRQPNEIEHLEGRLVSRFGWGLVTDIQPPDIETRMAILQSRAAEEHIEVPSDVLKHIAMCITSNIRELEGALITLLAFAKLTGSRVTLPVAEEVLRDLTGRNRIRPVTIEAVQRAVAERFDVRIADLRGASRQRQVAFPRQVAMFLCKTMIPNLSLSEVGEAFGGRDHTTVLYAVRKIQAEYGKNADTRQAVDQVQRMLRQ